MPTYGYRCSNCKNEFETFQKMSDAPLTTCEECGGTLKKILYPVGIAFKGEGFYVNDSVKTSTPNGKKTTEASEGAISSDKPAGESGGDVKVDKPESATPAVAATSTPSTD